MNDDILKNIYDNIVICFKKYRKLDVKEISHTDLIAKMKKDKFFVVEGANATDLKRTNKNWSQFQLSKPTNVYAVIVHSDSDHLESSGYLEVLLDKLPFIKSEKNNVELIFITPKPFTTILLKKISKSIRNEPDKPFTVIRKCEYDDFIFEKPRHKLAMPHKILTEDEKTKIFNTHNIIASNIPQIKYSDAMSVWYGIEIGDVVEVILYSESSGQEVSYKLCKH